MAKKKTEQVQETTALVKKEDPGALVGWEAEMAKEANAVAATVTVNAQRISFKGGRITVNGETVKDNKLNVIVVDFGHDKAYYAGAYNEDAKATPICYAFGRDAQNLKPHPAAPEPQCETCAACPHNKFGSAEQGKGKRCKDGVRLMVLPGSTKIDDVPTGEVFMASVPPTSLKHWATYVKGLKELGRTPWGVVTEISTRPFKSFFELQFKPINGVTEAMYRALKEKQSGGGIEEQMFAPYPTLSADEEEEKPKAKGKKAKF